MYDIDDLMQYCSNSSALAVELQQSSLSHQDVVVISQASYFYLGTSGGTLSGGQV